MAMAASVLTGCGGNKTAETSVQKQEETNGEELRKGETITLRLASNHAEDFVTAKACVKFADLVKEKTSGAVTVECYFNGVLGEEKQTIEQAQFGGLIWFV